jgi:hypothetical protein
VISPLALPEFRAAQQRLSQNRRLTISSLSPPSDGGEGRGEEACFCSGFPSPRSSPHAFLAGRGRKPPSFETVSATRRYRCVANSVFVSPCSASGTFGPTARQIREGIVCRPRAHMRRNTDSLASGILWTARDCPAPGAAASSRWYPSESCDCLLRRTRCGRAARGPNPCARLRSSFRVFCGLGAKPH